MLFVVVFFFNIKEEIKSNYFEEKQLWEIV